MPGRIRLALLHGDTAFETGPRRFGDKDTLPRSAQGRVPVLADGDLVVTDRWHVGQELGACSAAFLERHRRTLDPVRALLRSQDFLGGIQPRHTDHIPFGMLGWAHGVSTEPVLAPDT